MDSCGALSSHECPQMQAKPKSADRMTSESTALLTRVPASRAIHSPDLLGRVEVCLQ